MFEATVFRGRKAAEPLEMPDDLDLGPGQGSNRRRAAIPLPDPLKADQPAARRRPIMVVSGIVVVAVCAAMGALVTSRKTAETQYLAVAHFVPAGGRFSTSALETVTLPADVTGPTLLKLTDAGAVVNRFAAVPIEAGALLTPSDVSSGSSLPRGQALVGATLSADQFPSSLAVGDIVLVVLGGQTIGAPTSATASSGRSGQVPPGGSNASPGSEAVPLGRGTVVDLGPAGTADTNGGGGTLVTLQVPSGEAAAIAQASAAGDVSLAEIGGIHP